MHPLELHLGQSLLYCTISDSVEDEWTCDTGAAAVV